MEGSSILENCYGKGTTSKSILSSISTFLFYPRCKEEFKKDYMQDVDMKEYTSNIAEAKSEDEEKAIKEEMEALEMKLRRRSLGNFRFIGDLYKNQMVKGDIYISISYSGGTIEFMF